MVRKKKKINKNNNKNKKEKKPIFILPSEVKKWILAIGVFLIAVIIILSFFDLAGRAGLFLMRGLIFLIGKPVTFFVPVILVLGALTLFLIRNKNFLTTGILAIFILILGLAGLVESFESGNGGKIGYLLVWPFLKFFGSIVTKIIFISLIVIGGLIFWYFIRGPKIKQIGEQDTLIVKEKPSLIKKIFVPKFKVQKIEPEIKETSLKSTETILETKQKEEAPIKLVVEQGYKIPPLELLEKDRGKAAAGDVITNSAIIKKTLENFGLSVEMSEVNIGPTVTQYTLKPAEGIKLSKITALSNNLALALASHPIRIEAPIPGKSLVGIEVPNKIRCQIRLRDLIANPEFQNNPSYLTIVLGKDVSGAACYADLAKMPHLLVAGATGTGKTIFLNSLILSLLYRNSPENLRFILVDPKRVEFSAYRDLPHLLAPVIFDAVKTVNALKWLTNEMERRFDLLSTNDSRNIESYNKKILKEKEKPMPYIILIIDELADLMAAKGREMEAGIVRLAQMARAVGIHLVVATQRPSVEVITGLIKANITSRVTFQVASQVDSRTILDMAGAEKLLGSGDMLFISADTSKPKRIQGAYVSEKEVEKVTTYIRNQKEILKQEQKLTENHLAEDLQRILETGEGENLLFDEFTGEEDPLYEEAKRIIIETQKASASFLQRKLRIGYARAARLLDMLEKEGIVGPADGAKPREILLKKDDYQAIDEDNEEEEWKKV
ncbi:MAG: DNA translocase FtsK [Minisyncoccales bacterium]